MPFQLLVDQSIIRIDFSGTISVDDLTALAAEVHELEASMPRVPDRLTDLSGAVARASTFELILGMSRRRAATQFRNPFRSAIVARTPEMVGFARMFKILNRNPQITIQIFDSVAAAEQWLGVSAPLRVSDSAMATPGQSAERR